MLAEFTNAIGVGDKPAQRGRPGGTGTPTADFAVNQLRPGRNRPLIGRIGCGVAGAGEVIVRNRDWRQIAQPVIELGQLRIVEPTTGRGEHITASTGYLIGVDIAIGQHIQLVTDRGLGGLGAGNPAHHRWPAGTDSTAGQFAIDNLHPRVNGPLPSGAFIRPKTIKGERAGGGFSVKGGNLPLQLIQFTLMGFTQTALLAHLVTRAKGCLAIGINQQLNTAAGIIKRCTGPIDNHRRPLIVGRNRAPCNGLKR